MIKVMFLSLLLIASTIDTSQAASVSRNFKVALNISASDKLEKRLTSFFKREFRALGDVELVGIDPQYTFDVIALKITTKSDMQTCVGYAFNTSFLINYRAIQTSLLTKKPTFLFLRKDVNQDELDTSKIDLYSQDLVSQPSTSLNVVDCNIESLKSYVTDSVVEFDTKILDPEREYNKIIDDALNAPLSGAPIPDEILFGTPPPSP